jgi:hypothetical protein
MPAFHSTLLTTNDPQALVSQLAAVAGLDIPTSSVPMVSAHLVVAAKMAQLLFVATLDEELTPAAVFTLPTVTGSP